LTIKITSFCQIAQKILFMLKNLENAVREVCITKKQYCNQIRNPIKPACPYSSTLIRGPFHKHSTGF